MKVHIFGGGTVNHVRPHLALCAPAYGTFARTLHNDAVVYDKLEPVLHLTRMAGGNKSLETNADVAAALEVIKGDPEPCVVIMNVALCDYAGEVPMSGQYTTDPKARPRLRTSEGPQQMALIPADKLIASIRSERKDIYLVGFKTTSGATADEQFVAGLHLLKASSCNLVVANDIKTHRNMIITPERARYCVTADRATLSIQLVKMIRARAGLTFHRTAVLSPERLHDPEGALAGVLAYLADNGAYKPFRGVTVGHFAQKPEGCSPTYMRSSRRGHNFTMESDRRLIDAQCMPGGSIRAYGAKPSAGARSQMQLFADHPEYDCIVHFHCKMREGSEIPVRKQEAFECGSIECGVNTSDGIKDMGGIGAVMLEKHGPNIMFKATDDPERVIEFVKKNFDLSQGTSDVADGSI